MQRLQQRKTTICSILILVAIGTFFSIRVFSTASNQQPPSPREGDFVDRDSIKGSATISKQGTIKENPEITILSEVNGKVKTITSAEGEEIKGGQPILLISDEYAYYSSQVELAQSQLQTTQDLYDSIQDNYHQQSAQLKHDKEILQQQLQQLEQQLAKSLTSNEKELQLQQQTERINQQKETLINQRTNAFTSIQDSLTPNEKEELTLYRNTISNVLQSSDPNVPQSSEILWTILWNSPSEILWTILWNSPSDSLKFSEQFSDILLPGLQLLASEQEQLTILEQKDREAEKKQTLQQQENIIYQKEKEREEKKLTLKLIENEYTTQRETLENKLQSLRREYEHLYNQYNKLSVRAPLAGKLQHLLVQEGDNVYEGTPLFTIQKPAETTEIEIQLTLEEYLSLLSVQQVSIKRKNAEGKRITTTGDVLFRSPIANEQGMYTLSIETNNFYS